MVSLSRKLAKAFTFGVALGFCLYIISDIAMTVVGSLPSILPLAGFGIGLSCSIAATLAEDEKEQKPEK